MNAVDTPAPSNRIWIFFAVPQESQHLRRERPDLDCRHCGMGQANARRAVTDALDGLAGPSPDLIITAGFAGGLNPKHRCGQLLYETHGEHAFFASLAQHPHELARGTFHCHDRVLITPEEKQHWWEATGRDAVEMESGPIQGLARERAIPCLTLRVISDAASEAMPLDFNALMTPDYRMNPWKLTLALLRRPQRIPTLVRFNGNIQKCARKLAQGLSTLIPPTAPNTSVGSR